ncbi:MAG: hypothetical protein ACPGJF_03385 [Sinimarinibacterium flocculans]|uniref:hypothetical protein n=1 Tax=Sinimarinibacterium flocculans TaxID=985250 RepID=UPI003C37D82F
MTIHYYHSGQAGAPVLTGQAGSLVNLLDKCLVDGFGSQAPAGWEVAFSGTDKRVYRSGTIGGTRHYYRVLNDASVAGGSAYSYIRGFHAMSDVDTGTGPYPTVAQRTHGVTWASSTTSDSVARQWAVIADEKTVCFIVQGGADQRRTGFAFGEFEPASPSDVGHALVAGVSADANFNAADVALNKNLGLGTFAGLFLASSPDGLTISVQGGLGLLNFTAVGNFGVTGAVYPNPHIAGPVLQPVLVHDSAGRRGTMRIMHSPEHSASGSFPLSGTEVIGLDGMPYVWQRWFAQNGSPSAEAAVLFEIG